MEDQKIKDILKLFCSSESDNPREEFKSVFYQKGHTYATNGYKMIRIKGGFGDRQKRPYTSSLGFWNAIKSDPKIITAQIDGFDQYKSMIDEVEDCPECDGYGDVECICCGNEKTCENCDGRGEIPTGKQIEDFKENLLIKIGESYLNPCYFIDILKARDAIGCELVAYFLSDIVYFTCGEFELALMKVNPERVSCKTKLEYIDIIM
jgi:hypothetical protein